MKVIASDYDETLFRHDRIDQKDAEAIRAWRAAGNLFGINTARSYASIKSEIDRWNFEYDFLVCSTGCAVYDRDGESIYQERICREQARALIHEVLKFQPARLEIREGKTEWGVYEDGWGVQPFMKKLEVRDIFDTIGDINGLMAVFYTLEDCAAFVEHAGGLFAGSGMLVEGSWIVSDTRPRDSSKSKGMYRLLEAVGARPQDASVIGDGLSDVPMIREFGGYSMVQADPEAQACAKKLYASIAELIDDLGVAK